MDIWGTSCAACLSNLPFTKKLAKDLEGSAVDLIYVCVGSDRERWLAVSERFGVPSNGSYRLTGEQSRELSRLFRYNGIPRYVIFDREGEIVDHHAKQPSSSALKDELLEIAGG